MIKVLVYNYVFGFSIHKAADLYVFLKKKHFFFFFVFDNSVIVLDLFAKIVRTLTKLPVTNDTSEYVSHCF